MGQIISQFIDDIFFLFSRPVERLEHRSPPTSEDDYSSGSEAEAQVEDPPPAYEYPQQSPEPVTNDTTRRTVTFFQNASNIQMHGCTFSVQKSSYTRVVDQGQGGKRGRQKSKHTGTTGGTMDISPQAEEFFKSFQGGPKTGETRNEFYCHGAKITRMNSDEFHKFFTSARMNFDASVNGWSSDPGPQNDAQNSGSGSSTATIDKKDRLESSSVPTQDAQKDHPRSSSPVQNANEGSSTSPREALKESSNAASETDFDFEIVLAGNENKGEE